MKIKNNSVIGLLGPNGAGKTTTFYMTIGMIKPDKGHVFLDDEDITTYPMYLRARRGVGYLPQETSTFKKLTVKQNIMAILETLSISKLEQEERADMLLDELGIKHLMNQNDGKIIESGPPEKIVSSKTARRIYLGDEFKL
jgi:lipopolysaccharide export system ATP-binding protein